MNIDQGTRAWIYRVSVLALPLLVAYGAISEQKAPLWAALLGGIFVPGLAAINTPTKE